MAKVLIITNLLPIPEIAHKRNENDILLITEDNLKAKYPENTFQYVFVVPSTNKLLARISRKWESYYNLKEKGECEIKGRIINILGVWQLPKSTFFRTILYDISLYLNKRIIQNLIEDYKPTIIHAQNADVDAYMARKIGEKYNIPYVVTLRGFKRASDFVVKTNIKSAKELIAISPTQKKQAAKLTDNTIQLIPHGIPRVFYAKHCSKSVHSKSPLRLISVCRLLKLKKMDLVIKALSNIEEEYVLDIYGEGPEMSNIKVLIDDVGLSEKIQLKGFVSHSKLPEIFRRYDLFIMPSFPETLGRVYFEAMASRLPVIASKGTGVDGVIQNKKHGFLVEPNSEKDIETTLRYVITNQHKLISMGENAFCLAQQYSWDETLPKIQQIYASQLTGN